MYLQRLLIVPPELAYGKKGVQEIPPNATIEVSFCRCIHVLIPKFQERLILFIK